MAIYDYFSRHDFTYSLQTQGGTSGEDIVNFLDSKQGFCQQYAAAMAWMVRAAGIPARVAFGFTNGTSRDGNSTTLTNLNLHAWTEVYFGPSYGWVPFDATPPVQRPRLDPAGVGARPQRAAQPPRRRAARPPGRARPVSPGAAGQDPERGRFDDERRGRRAGQQRPDLADVPARRGHRAARAARDAGAASLAAAPAAAVHHEHGRGDGGDRDGRRPRRASATVVVTGAEAARVRADAHAAWDELIDTMVDYRVPIDPTETPRATAERLVRGGTLGRRGRGGPAAGAGGGAGAVRPVADRRDRSDGRRCARCARSLSREGHASAPGCSPSCCRRRCWPAGGRARSTRRRRWCPRAARCANACCGGARGGC